MENIKEKAVFLKEVYTKKLAKIAPDTEHLWGKINVQQMIEHMSDMFRIASGKELIKLETPEEHLPRMQAFLQSEKPFRENTPNKLMPEIPPPARHTEIKDSIKELQEEIDHFFSVYEKETGKSIINPFFGDLDYEMQVQLLYKHGLHHLRQFGVE